jgi:hypothetical protein
MVQEAIQCRHNTEIACLFGYEENRQFLFHIGRLVLMGGDLFDIAEASLPTYMEPVLDVAFRSLEDVQLPRAATMCVTIFSL